MKGEGFVHGVGINDADYQVSKKVEGRQILCRFYDIWKAMLQRCYSEKCQLKHHTYKGCTVAATWHSFMEFRSWMVKQDWVGKHLDKDILFEGNKVYGPDTCVFIDRRTNNFILDNASVGDLPVGVTKLPSGKYRARVKDLHGNRVHLGCFNTPREAHIAWGNAKYTHAVSLAKQQTDQRVSDALIKRYSNVAF